MARAFVQSMDMKIEASKKELLVILKNNRETHKKILSEAREGYIKAARAAIEHKLDELRTGECVRLTFHLSPPQDYTATYDTVIKMAELHQADTITLSANEVRCLMMDEWDWMDQFLVMNKAYSGLANAYADAKGIV